MALALFDLDNTLLGGDSDHSWGEFLCSQGAVDARLYKEANDNFYRDYTNGTLDIIAYQEFALAGIKDLNNEKREALHKQFMKEIIEPMVLSKAVDLVQKHKDNNDTCVIITATNSFVTGPIAKRFGIDHLLATEPEVINGLLTGKLDGDACFQDGKITKLQQWLGSSKYSLEGASFYSDSFNDLPLLKKVDNPYAVDPDPRLAQYASEQNWPIISLR